MLKYPRSIYKLYLVTDRYLAQGRSLLEIIDEAISGGVTLVQLREKTATTKEFLYEGLKIQNLLKQKKIPLIINDRLDIALALDADGLHIGQDDLPLEYARKIWKDKILGVSVENISQAIEAEKLGADYLGISPVYQTATKSNIQRALGIQMVRDIRNAVTIPLVGIGGMNKRTARATIEAGADGVAVVSAIIAAEDPKNAASEIFEEVNKLYEA